MPSSPTTPSFPVHSAMLSVFRCKALYHWPRPSAEYLQQKLQALIAVMKKDGYTTQIIAVVLRSCADVTLRESAECGFVNWSRAVFFSELIKTELLDLEIER